MMSDEVEPNPIPRDRMQRPLIIPPGGGKPVAYTRVSTFAKALSDNDSLSQWKRKMIVEGVLANPGLLQDLMHAASCASPATRPDLINRYIEAFHDAGGGNVGSKWGTALHGLTEFVDADGWVPEQGTIPADLFDALHRYIALVRDIEMIACEGFVVVDEIKAAGSYDRIMLLPDGRLVIGDIKTGPKIHSNVAETQIQLACYARGVHYAPDGTREVGPLEGIDTSMGVLIQISRDNTGDRLLELDLDQGWEDAQVALDVRKRRSRKPRGTYIPAPF